MCYQKSKGALTVHVNPKMNRSKCASLHKRKGRANYFDYIKLKYVCTVEGCGSRAISEQYLKNHLNKAHRFSAKTQNFDLDTNNTRKKQTSKKEKEQPQHKIKMQFKKNPCLKGGANSSKGKLN